MSVKRNSHTSAPSIDTAHAKTLVYCSAGSPRGFDPAPYNDIETANASGRPLYNCLLEFEPGTSNLIPGLAESWSISKDGTEVTFHLRRGVKFHSTPYFTPTRDFNADDVIFSFTRLWEKDHPWHDYDPSISWEDFRDTPMGNIFTCLRRDDDYTVTFGMKEQVMLLQTIFAEEFTSVVSAEYAAQLEASNSKPKLNTHPIGTGPFQFVAYQPDTEIRYKAHPQYWNGVSAIDDLVFSITPDASERLEKLKAGVCHMASYVHPVDVESFKQAPGIIVSEQVGSNTWYLAYNTRIPPFDNVNVRKALNMSINKQAIVDKAFHGGAVVAKNPISPTMWSYNDNTQDEPYDPSSARILLRREGVSNLKMSVWVEKNNTDEISAAELIQADFAAVGVEVEIISYVASRDGDHLTNIGRPAAVLANSKSHILDPSTFLYTLTCGGVGDGNLANWCNEEFDDVTWRASDTSDKAERTRLYEQAQLVFKREAPWAPIAHNVFSVPMSDKVIGYKADSRGLHRFDGVDLAE